MLYACASLVALKFLPPYFMTKFCDSKATTQCHTLSRSLALDDDYVRFMQSALRCCPFCVLSLSLLCVAAFDDPFILLVSGMKTHLMTIIICSSRYNIFSRSHSLSDYFRTKWAFSSRHTYTFHFIAFVTHRTYSFSPLRKSIFSFVIHIMACSFLGMRINGISVKFITVNKKCFSWKRTFHLGWSLIK